MKKVIIAVMLTSLIFLTSCIPQNTEIRYRLVIEGIGIDYDTENDLYELTVQVLETGNSDPEQGKKLLTRHKLHSKRQNNCRGNKQSL